jgi:hypothetical protein
MKPKAESFLKTTLVMMLFCVLRTAEAQFTDGLVAYYPFHGNALDVTGNGHDGTVNGAVLASDRYGQTNRAYSFTGAYSPDTEITISNWVAFQFPADFTVCAWINFTGGTESPRIFSTVGYEVGCANERLYFNNNFNAATTQGVTLYSTHGFPQNTWVHVVGRRSGTNLNIFVNGIVDGQAIANQPPDYSRTFIPKIGRNCVSLYDAFGGSIDDIRLYNRALTDQEIVDLYAFERPAKLAIETAAVRLGWFAVSNYVYEVQWSLDFQTWSNVASVVGAGTSTNVVDWTDGPKRFYRVLTTTP